MSVAGTAPEGTGHVGERLREWRRRRRFSQMELALETGVSTRHLSFIETGRSRPGRDMVLALAGVLDVPLRERNVLLASAGFAPVFPEHSLDDPALADIRGAVASVLAAHDPFPALAVDRHWSLGLANDALSSLIDGVDPGLLQPPVNVLRLSVHPGGLASRIVNFEEWRGHLVQRLLRQVEASGDAVLADLADELRAYPVPGAAARTDATAGACEGIVTPLQLATGEGVLSLFSTTTVFGTPVDVMLSELAIEAFFPADAGTRDRLRRLAAKRGRG